MVARRRWSLVQSTQKSPAGQLQQGEQGDDIHPSSQRAAWSPSMAPALSLGPGPGMRLTGLPGKQWVWVLGSVPTCVWHHQKETGSLSTQKVSRNTKNQNNQSHTRRKENPNTCLGLHRTTCTQSPECKHCEMILNCSNQPERNARINHSGYRTNCKNYHPGKCTKNKHQRKRGERLKKNEEKYRG